MSASPDWVFAALIDPEAAAALEKRPSDPKPLGSPAPPLSGGR